MTGTEPTTRTPVWLLDLDGVINAPRAGWHAAPRSGLVSAMGRTWRIRWAPQVVDFVREVHLTGLAEVRWATTWVRFAGDLERLLRLPALPTAFPPDTTTPNQDKVPAALGVLAEGRPLVWTDDEMIPTEGPDRARLDAADSLLITPRSARGLRPDDIDRIADYLARVDHAPPLPRRAP